jgi:hypothetical protein
MALSAIGRKHLLPHGAQREIAQKFGLSDAYVTSVVKGEDFPATSRGWQTYRKVQVAIARKLRMRLDEAFSPTERGVQEEAMVA